MKKQNLYPKNFPTPPDPLEKGKLADILTNELQEWKIVKSPLPINPDKERIEIYRELIFEDFDQVVDFITDLRPICNILTHHPRWENTWKTLRIYLSTWDSKHIITYKDILLARNIEILYVNEFRNKYDYDMNDSMKPEINVTEIKLFIKALKDLIAKNKVEDVFKKIDTYFDKNEYLDKPNNLYSIQSSYSSLMSKLMDGTISTADANTEMSQINGRILKALTVGNLSGG